MELQPYLSFRGDCEAALAFYQTIFGGSIEGLMRFRDAPAAGHTPPGFDDKIMHATFAADGVKFMASDGPTLSPADNNGRSTLAIGSPSHDEGERVFNALAAGGTVTMPYTKQFWGASFGMLTDKYGLNWMVNAGGPG